MVDGKTEGVKTDVPGLIGVYDTPPYGREGQWATLEAMVEYAVEFTGGTLTAEEMAALNAYVRQIPGDALWLNSARPLSGSDHVWVETPIELTFSQLLAPGQEDLFSMAIAEDEPVAGDWTISGRVARFEPTDGTLVHETDYTIEVGAGLEGALGQVLRSPLTIEFATGGVPETDVSGKWLATLQATQVLPGLIDFDPQADIAFLQATGGNMTGVINSQFDVATISHIEGVVSGMTMVLEPFLFDTDFGQIKLESGFAEMVDENGDGWAEYGVGEVSALGYTVPWFMHRVSIPE